MLKTCTYISAIVLLLASVTAQARKTTPRKVDVRNLEKRYWAPKDKKYRVVQNRTYTKTKKIFVSVLPGIMLNEEYSTGFSYDLAVGYFFNDRWGLELEYQGMLMEDNDLQTKVIELSGFADHGKTTSYIGVTGKWMPLYAKMSWLGSKIVYFDLSLGLSLGMMQYDQQILENPYPADKSSTTFASKSAPAVGFEVSQSFYLSKKLLLRVDYKQRFFSEEVLQGTGGSKGQKREDRIDDSISLNLGMTYIF